MFVDLNIRRVFFLASDQRDSTLHFSVKHDLNVVFAKHCFAFDLYLNRFLVDKNRSDINTDKMTIIIPVRILFLSVALVLCLVHISIIKGNHLFYLNYYSDFKTISYILK